MSRTTSFFILTLWLILAFLPLFQGFSYYWIPLAERPFSELHDLFKPSGPVGHGLGIFGSLLILIGVSTYSARKRWHFLHKYGKLRNWLSFHIFVCTLGPFWILLHTTFKIGNIVSIAFWSMTVVVLSGIFGRYVYTRIPKTANGVFFTDQDLAKEESELLEALRVMMGMDHPQMVAWINRFAAETASGFMDALVKALRFDLHKRQLQRNMRRALQDTQVALADQDKALSLLFSYTRLDQQRKLTHPFQKLFGYWHVLHLPLAMVMLIVFIIHVGVAIAFGYTWIF